MNIKEQLYNYLMENHQGRENAVHSKDLEDRFKISPRTIRNYINSMRKSGKPICSDEKGYWIGINPKEIDGTIKRLGDFAGEVSDARMGLSFANIQLRSVVGI